MPRDGAARIAAIEAARGSSSSTSKPRPARGLSLSGSCWRRRRPKRRGSARASRRPPSTASSIRQNRQQGTLPWERTSEPAMPRWINGHGRWSSSSHRCLPRRRTAATRRPRRAAAKRQGVTHLEDDGVGDGGHRHYPSPAEMALGAAARGLDLGQLGHGGGRAGSGLGRRVARPVEDHGGLLDGHQPLLDHFVEDGEKALDLVLGVDDLDEDRQVLREAQDAAGVDAALAPNPSKPRNTVAPARPRLWASLTMASKSGRPFQRSDSPTKTRRSCPSRGIFIRSPVRRRRRPTPRPGRGGPDRRHSRRRGRGFPHVPD